MMHHENKVIQLVKVIQNRSRLEIDLRLVSSLNKNVFINLFHQNQFVDVLSLLGVKYTDMLKFVYDISCRLFKTNRNNVNRCRKIY